jgi:death-on-curing protein
VIRYISLAEYLWLAEQVTGVEAAVLAKSSRIDLADSALHAPSASFGGEEFYLDVFDKAAVLACRLAWNHPLVDGNKRAAWAAMVLFIDLNSGEWEPDPPDIDEAEQAMLVVAAHEVDEPWLSAWLRERVRFS